jgi:RecA/RadA recombinase
MSLIDKLRKNTTISETSILSKSKLINEKDLIQTSVPMINVALSGDLNGGLSPGITEIAGPSKYFKSSFGLLLVNAFLEKYPDGACLFYDSEFGTPESSFNSFEVDQNRVLHTPITDVELLKIDVMNQLKEINKGDRVIIFFDSLGQTASRKEVEDVEAGKVVADMSRAKAVKSLFRMITPHLRLKELPMIVINHTYKEIGMYPKDIAGGGTGLTYAADTIWIMGRRQEKDNEDEHIGYSFIINIEKSRFVKEKSQIPITVTFDGGIEKYSGLLDIALEGKFVTNPTKGWYALPGSDKKMRKSDTLTEEFWSPILKDTAFQEFVKGKYEISSRPIFHVEQAISEED